MNGTTLYTTDVNAPTGFRAATLDEIMAGARHALSIRIRKGTVLNSPKATADFLLARLAQREYETFTLIYLDNRHRLIACQETQRRSRHPGAQPPERNRRTQPRRRAHHDKTARSLGAGRHPCPRSPDCRRRRDPQFRRKGALVSPSTGKLTGMTTELDVLKRVSEGLSSQILPFMLSGSFALAYYATPRMTRDLDIVVALAAGDVEALLSAFASDFYIDADTVRAAIQNERLFNMMHLGSGIKVDMIVRKSSEYRLTEFARRQQVTLGSVLTWIVSREDLILSKLVWSLDSGSDLQLRDVRQLLAGPIDVDYVNRWAPVLGVETPLRELMR
jgi:hypothetical protein